MDQLISLPEASTETVILVGVQHPRGREWEVHDSLDELAQLTSTAGANVVDQVVCRQTSPNPATFIGKGKAEEIGRKVEEENVATVVFDEDLTPAQGRNLEKLVGTKVVDRTQVILDIFAQHAQTREGQLQIQLAQLEYLLPRLRHMWTHLERQQGGIGLRGPGEKQLEMDRRRIQAQLARLKAGLEQVRGRRGEQRRGRRRHGWALLALVGYTNAGKSTLLNALTGSKVTAYSQLFATLDPTTRRLQLPNHQPALLTDTVGFIRKLPHHLVESFKATLEEVIEADILLHVIDTAHPRVDGQIEAVEEVLRELGAHDKHIIPVLNKIDRSAGKTRARGLQARLEGAVTVSAKSGEGLEHLGHVIADALKKRNARVRLKIPLAEGKMIAMVRSEGHVLSEVFEDGFAVMEASVPVRVQGLCERFLVDEAPTVEDQRS